MGINLRERGWDEVHAQVPSSFNQIDVNKYLPLINRISPIELENHGVITRAGNTGYTCPECGNGTGDDSTGVDIVDMGDHYGAQCKRCGTKFNNIKFLSHHYHLDSKTDFIEIIRRAIDEFNLKSEKNYNTTAPKCHENDSEKKAKAAQNGEQIDDETKKKIEEAMYEFIASDVTIAKAVAGEVLEDKAPDEKIFRGFTASTLKTLNICRFNEWTHPKIKAKAKFGKASLPKITFPYVIIPSSERHYLAILPKEFRNQVKKNFWKPHAGKKEIYCPQPVSQNAELIIISESETDAISIWQATRGKYDVLAIGGVGEYEKAAKFLQDKFTDHKPKILILFDPDETGRENAPKLREELLSLGFSTVYKFFSDDVSKLDANDILIEQGDEKLAEMIDVFVVEAKEEFEAAELDIRARLEHEAKIKSELEKAEAATVADFVMTEELHKKIYYTGTTDMDNAERLAALFKNELRYICDLELWAFYENGIWTLAPSGSNSAIFHFVNRASKIIAANAKNDSEKKKALAFKNYKKFSPACSSLKSIPEIRIKSTKFNKPSMLLNVANGVIDLTTGKLLKHSPDYYFTKRCPVIYDPKHRSKVFDDFMKSILPDEKTRRAVLRYLGYCLTGDVREEKALFIVGSGRNGKGTLSRALMTLMGDYATPFKIDALLARRFDKDGDAPTPEFSKLEGRRVAIANEVPQDRFIDAAHFKDLTGGDKISIRRLHRESSTIENPTHHFIFSGQHLPKIKDANDLGMKERLIIVKFPQSFTGENCDPNLKYKLLEPENLSGMLTVLIEECLAWQKKSADGGGLIISDAMRTEKQNYLDANDFIQEFVAEYCILGADKSCKRQDLLQSLRKHCYNDCKDLSERALTEMIKKLDGVTYDSKKNRRAGRIFFGIGLIDEAERELNFEGIPDAPPSSSSKLIEEKDSQNDEPQKEENFDLQSHTTEPPEVLDINDVHAVHEFTYKMEANGKSNEEIKARLIEFGMAKERAPLYLHNPTAEDEAEAGIPLI